jgi:hypothetical protein
MKTNSRILHSAYATKPVRQCKWALLLYPRIKGVKYLGMHLDKILTWAKHIKSKRKQLNQKGNKHAGYSAEDQHYQ